jgi:tryptophan 2,3-dioxygenase
MLARIARIFEQLNQAWNVLRTMTPSEYTEFRDALGKSSGFQSYQYRAIEFLVGNRNPAMLRPYPESDARHQELKAILSEPGLYDETLRLLAREGFALPAEIIERNWSAKHQQSSHVISAWRAIYAAPEEHWTLYELAEKLMDFEDYFRRWRFNHVTTVERIIGLKRGTGGTSGVAYLKLMLEVELFPELWRVRTQL